MFVDALERLDYRMESLLATPGSVERIWMTRTRAYRVRSGAAMFRRALEQRPMKNAGMRLATVTPLGAFPLIDYLIATSQSVGEGLTRLARYLRLAEAHPFPAFARTRTRFACYSRAATPHSRPSSP